MKNLKTSAASVLLLLVLHPLESQGQKRTPVLVCKRAADAAFKELPQLEYDCPEGLIESDDKILQLPQRTEALKRVAKGLESLTDAGWWLSDVDDLNACELHGEPGPLNEEEKQRFKDGAFQFQLLGNHEMRLVLLPDPCYQPGYNGANSFLLYRKEGRVFVTQVLSGYYSRVDNSVGIGFAELKGQQIIEISTGNSMPPAIRNYYFVIDPKTNQAVPMKLFKEGKVLTNEMSSAMMLGEPSELGLPRGSRDMTIIRHHRLLPSFTAYSEAYGDGDGRKLHRTVYRWNGRFYAAVK